MRSVCKSKYTVSLNKWNVCTNFPPKKPNITAFDSVNKKFYTNFRYLLRIPAIYKFYIMSSYSKLHKTSPIHNKIPIFFHQKFKEKIPPDLQLIFNHT